MKHSREIGLILGILLAISILVLPLNDLSHKGHIGLALTMMTVCFWAFQVTQAGFSSGLYLALLIILKVAEPKLVLASWTGSTMYLIIGAYLIAGAVKTSGLGERIAYKFILLFVHSFKSIIISIFILTFLLSILIPHPWPRAFLIMSVMGVLINSAGIKKEDAVKIGFAVFAASVPISLIFLTGDSTINPLAIQYSGLTLGWMGWLKVMGLPAILSSIITCVLLLALFKPSEEIKVNKDLVRNTLNELGPFTSKEKRIVIWLGIAIVLWMTDELHKIDIGWITLLIPMLMSMPIVGGSISAKSWKEVPIQVLLFITAAIAIGKVGAETGMNSWIAHKLLFSTIPTNYFLLALFITTISIIIHMFLGSVIAVMGVAIPALLEFTLPLGINSLVITLWVFTSISIHYLLPFHHLNILVGQGEENGMYTQKETLRLGIPLTVAVYLITSVIELSWWKIIGLL